MQFHETLALIESDKNNQTITLPEGWAQGRAFFGGFSAAVAAQFLLQQFPQDYHLRSFAISFVAPATPGDATLSYRVLRQGSSVLQVAVELTQNNEVMLAGLASLGKGRQSSVSVSGETPPDLKTVRACQRLILSLNSPRTLIIELPPEECRLADNREEPSVVGYASETSSRN